jgi:hypothetical protein
MADELTEALREIAGEDAARAAAAAPAMSPRLAAEFHARYAARRGLRGGRWVGLAMAAALVVAVAIPLWVASKGALSLGSSAVGAGAAARGEVATAFLPLTYSAVPLSDAQIIRIEVPRAVLGTFGLLPIDDGGLGADVKATVQADVIVGEDGLARAVRFVRQASN